MNYPVYFSLGSNLGNRQEKLSKARELIEKRIAPIKKASSVYETEAWGFNAEKPFLNQIVQIATNMPAMEILEKIQKIETDLGRKQTSHGYKSRQIDIDILFYGDEIIREGDKLILPHPLLAERLFVLRPLTEIAGNLKHPALNKTIDELIEECRDTSWIIKLDEVNEV